MAEIRQELLEELLKDYERPEDLTGPDGVLKELFRRLIETAAGAVAAPSSENDSESPPLVSDTPAVSDSGIRSAKLFAAFS